MRRLRRWPGRCCFSVKNLLVQSERSDVNVVRCLADITRRRARHTVPRPRRAAACAPSGSAERRARMRLERRSATSRIRAGGKARASAGHGCDEERRARRREGCRRRPERRRRRAVGPRPAASKAERLGRVFESAHVPSSNDGARARLEMPARSACRVRGMRSLTRSVSSSRRRRLRLGSVGSAPRVTHVLTTSASPVGSSAPRHGATTCPSLPASLYVSETRPKRESSASAAETKGREC